MTERYSVGEIRLPMRVKEVGLDKLCRRWGVDFRQQEEADHVRLIQEEDPSFQIGTARERVDGFIRGIAGLLKGSVLDNQIISYNFDGVDMGFIVIHDGLITKTSYQNLVLQKGHEPHWIRLNNGMRILGKEAA